MSEKKGLHENLHSFLNSNDYDIIHRYTYPGIEATLRGRLSSKSLEEFPYEFYVITISVIVKENESSFNVCDQLDKFSSSIYEKIKYSIKDKDADSPPYNLSYEDKEMLVDFPVFKNSNKHDIDTILSIIEKELAVYVIAR